MNLLIDCLSLMRKNGAAEYLRRIISELIALTDQQYHGVSLFGVYDSRYGIAYSDMQPDAMEHRGVSMIDVSSTNLVEITQQFHIDSFFIGCVQELENHKDLADLKCRVVVVAHDLSFEEIHRDDIDIYCRVQEKSTASLINWLLLHKRKSRTHTWHIVNTVKLMHNNPKAEIVAVSEYTKNSILYAYNVPGERIHVLYSPERLYLGNCGDEGNADLKALINSGKRFLLLLGTQHSLKNTHKAVRAFKRFAEHYPDFYLVTTGKQIEKQFANHIPLPFLSEDDLQKAYQNCYALIYPTLFEGFGYPPVEVMRYGKPVLASNIGPVREVLANAPIYFSPIYESDIYQALCLFQQSDYASLQLVGRMRYQTIRDRQEKDLKGLLDLILQQ